VLIARGRADEAARSAEASLATLERRDEVEIIGEGAVRVSYATALCALGALDRAEEEARAACDLLRLAAGVRLSALAALAAVLLRRGRAEEALRCATEAAEGHTSRRFHGPRHAQAHLIRAEALGTIGCDAGQGRALEILAAQLGRADALLCLLCLLCAPAERGGRREHQNQTKSLDSNEISHRPSPRQCGSHDREEPDRRFLVMIHQATARIREEEDVPVARTPRVGGLDGRGAVPEAPVVEQDRSRRRPRRGQSNVADRGARSWAR
jgi:hypothetical protein